MKIGRCTEKNVSLLAKLNKELIEDEESDNPMSIQETKKEC